MTNRRTKNSPKSGRSLGHVTPTIFGSMVGYPSDSLASCLKVVMVAADATASGNLFHSSALWLKECFLNSCLELFLYSLNQTCRMTLIGRGEKPRDCWLSADYHTSFSTGSAVKCRPEVRKSLVMEADSVLDKECTLSWAYVANVFMPYNFLF